MKIEEEKVKTQAEKKAKCFLKINDNINVWKLQFSQDRQEHINSSACGTSRLKLEVL